MRSPPGRAFVPLELRVLLLLSCAQPAAAKSFLQDINPANIELRINNTSDAIVATWGRPNPNISSDCYASHLQYKRQSDDTWENVHLKDFSFWLPSPDWTKTYAFRLRMKYECLARQWSSWTPEKFWRSGTVLGPDTPLLADATFYFLLLLIPLTISLLYCIFSQKWIRRALISQIPDPKHTIDDLLCIEQPQWWPSLESPCVDCVTVEIEIVCLEKEEEADGTTCTKPHPSDLTSLTPTDGHGDAEGGTWPPKDPQSPYVYL